MPNETEVLKKEIESLKDTVKSLTEKLNEKAMLKIPQEELEKLNALKEEASEVFEKIKNKNKENPLAGIAIAAAAGFIIGKLFCGKENE